MRGKATTSGFTNLRLKLKHFEDAGKNSVHSVDVGITRKARYPDDKERGHAPTVAQVAFWNEFGARAGGWGGPTPPRPFMRNTMAAAKKDQRALDVVRQGITAESPSFDPDTAHRLGVVIQGIMKEQMLSPDLKPNAPATIKKKGSSQPLVDTAQMRRMIAGDDAVRVNHTKPQDDESTFTI